jgi:hypothetical protein
MKEVNPAWDTYYLQQLYNREKKNTFSSHSLFALTAVFVANKES